MSACVLEHDPPALALGGLLLCGRHRDALDDMTREIAALIVDTCRIRDGGAPAEATARQKHRKISASPAPGDVTIMALFDRHTDDQPRWASQVVIQDNRAQRVVWYIARAEVVDVLSRIASWLLLVAEERPLTATLPRSVLGQLDLLSRHHEWLAAHDAVDDYWSEMRDIRQHLRSAVRDHTHKRVGTCDLPTEGERACGGALLVENGSDVIRCASCRAAWTTPQEQARLAVRIA